MDPHSLCPSVVQGSRVLDWGSVILDQTNSRKSAHFEMGLTYWPRTLRVCGGFQKRDLMSVLQVLIHGVLQDGLERQHSGFYQSPKEVLWIGHTCERLCSWLSYSEKQGNLRQKRFCSGSASLNPVEPACCVNVHWTNHVGILQNKTLYKTAANDMYHFQNHVWVLPEAALQSIRLTKTEVLLFNPHGSSQHHNHLSMLPITLLSQECLLLFFSLFYCIKIKCIKASTSISKLLNKNV